MSAWDGSCACECGCACCEVETEVEVEGEGEGGCGVECAIVLGRMLAVVVVVVVGCGCSEGEEEVRMGLWRSGWSVRRCWISSVRLWRRAVMRVRGSEGGVEDDENDDDDAAAPAGCGEVKAGLGGLVGVRRGISSYLLVPTSRGYFERWEGIGLIGRGWDLDLTANGLAGKLCGGQLARVRHNLIM